MICPHLQLRRAVECPLYYVVVPAVEPFISLAPRSSEMFCMAPSTACHVPPNACHPSLAAAGLCRRIVERVMKVGLRSWSNCDREAVKREPALSRAASCRAVIDHRLARSKQYPHLLNQLTSSIVFTASESIFLACHQLRLQNDILLLSASVEFFSHQFSPRRGPIWLVSCMMIAIRIPPVRIGISSSDRIQPDEWHDVLLNSVSA